MQTFLPFSDFVSCARVLDNKRLGKQRVEAWQILRAITDDSYGWQNHPAVNMWRGRVGALCEYGIAMCREWRERGFEDNMMRRFVTIHSQCQAVGDTAVPDWMGDARIHQSHRAALLAKDFSWYSQWHWKQTPSISYFWPTHASA